MAQEEEDIDFSDDEELARIRESRIAEMKSRAQELEMQKTMGHGSFTEIVQDEFLREVTNSKFVVVHFFHKDFTRCKIMDSHLERITQQFFGTKFLKIEAEKAPFFVNKLQIKVLPAVVCFIDGVATDRLVGFDELGGSDSFKTETLIKWLGKAGVLNVKTSISRQEKKYKDDDSDD
eukprot:TRINITY_DN452_c0_g1_i1.p1 TRINITY_DN452_c0_g1~~TRINITY_DN452_c0_g1_i1.p1  ORF type:complete len:177 (+),score=35.23 TRINITY_DN452_c0_g1_i1:211-741(+)